MAEQTEKNKTAKKWVSTDKYRDGYDMIFRKGGGKKEVKEQK